MKDDESHSIFNAYNKHQSRLAKINYLRENFQEGGNPFAGDSNGPGGGSKDDDSEESKNDSEETKNDSEESKSDSEESKSDTKSHESDSKPAAPKKKDGKLSEEELDEELDMLAAKKDKIQKLFDSESIDKEVAQNALAKIKNLTNQLVEKYI